VDHPPAPEGRKPRSRADEAALGLNKCVATYILPENVLNWKLLPDREYEWVVIREFVEGEERFRKWTATGWTLYDAEGKKRDEGTHPYGCVPIFRAFDKRKPRCDNAGQSRYEFNAQVQLAYYNVDSELTLSNSLAAHPTLSGPEKMLRPGQGVPIGPGGVLPIPDGAPPWAYVSPDSGPAEKLRQKLMDYRDENDRAACLTKPAGAAGTTGTTVAQSGISKRLDQKSGNRLLASIAGSLQQLEKWAAHAAAEVLNDGPVDPAFVEEIEVVYPRAFDLQTAGDLLATLQDLQGAAALAGALPETESEYLSRAAVEDLPGLTDERQNVIRTEIETHVKAWSALRGAGAPPPPAAGRASTGPAGRHGRAGHGHGARRDAGDGGVIHGGCGVAR
jgi:hypothetical protein